VAWAIDLDDRGGSLRRRLTITYTAALAVGLSIFAVVSLATIDQNLKSTLDARLGTTVRALAATAAGRVGRSKLDPTIVRRLFGELGIQQNGAIVESGGKVVLQNGVVPDAVLRFVRADTGSAVTYATVPGSGGLRVAGARVAGPGVAATVVVWRPIDVIADYERIALVTLAATSLVIILAAFAAGTLIVERGLQPLRAMTLVASEIEAFDLTRRLDNGDWDDELRTFARTFDRMLDRLDSAFQRQRQFTADASHDLRAPLSVMRAEADLALARARRPDFDEASFESIRDEVVELDRLLEGLLLSARADAEPFQPKPIDLVGLAARASGRLQPFALSRSVHIANAVEASPPISGDAEILERMLMSLLHNGIKFSPENGTVSLCVRASADAVSLIVRDEGPGFSNDALEFACDRFWKGDTARGRGGTGLGLAIAKSAVERVGGSIAIRNTHDGGAEVETSFPRANA
jgi:signal transduction histidine kinase